MQSVSALLLDLEYQGVEFWLSAEQLHYRAPTGVLNHERLAEIRARRQEILAFLRSRELASSEPRLEAARHRGPLPIATVQERFFGEYDRLVDPVDQHLSRVTRIRGHLDEDAFCESVQEVVDRHAVLRSRYLRIDGRPAALVDDTLRADVAVAELRATDPMDLETQARAQFTTLLERRFTLAKAGLLRVRLIRLSPDDHLLIVVIHHIVSDAWSRQILLEDIASLYAARVSRSPPTLPDLPIQYGDYALWQRQVETDQGEHLLAYWRARLSGIAADPFWLPEDRYPTRGPPRKSFTGKTPVGLVTRLRQVGRNLQSTTFAVVIGAVFTLIAGWSGRADILVASHWTGRHRRQVQNLIGCFAQLRALRVKLDPFDTFADVVTKVHATQQEDLPYLKLPYQRIRERILSSENRASPAEILVNYVPLGGASMPDRGDSKIGMLGEIEDLHWRLAAPLVDNRNFRLYLTFEETPDYLNWFVRFSGKFFSDSTIDAISLDLQAVLENVSSNPSRRLSAIRVPRLEAQAASVSGARVPASAS